MNFYDKRVRRIISAIIIVIVAAMVLTMVLSVYRVRIRGSERPAKLRAGSEDSKERQRTDEIRQTDTDRMAAFCQETTA